MANERTRIVPGDIIRDELLERGWVVEDLARAMNLSTQEVEEIVAGTAIISRDVAEQLSAALGASVQFWLNLQHECDAAQARRRIPA